MPIKGSLLGEFESYRGVIGRIRTESLSAWGEMTFSREKFWILSKDFQNYLEEKVLGRDPFSILGAIYESSVPFPVMLEAMFLDLVGKKAGMPWSKMYGRKKESVEIVFLRLPGEEGIKIEGNSLIFSSGSFEMDKIALSSLEGYTIFYIPPKDAPYDELMEWDIYIVSESPSAKNVEVPLINKRNYLGFLHPRTLPQYYQYYDYAIVDVSSLGISASIKVANLLEISGTVPIFYPGVSTSLLNSVAFNLSLLFSESMMVLTSHALYEDPAIPCFEIRGEKAYDLERPGIGAGISKTILAKYSGRRWKREERGRSPLVHF